MSFEKFVVSACLAGIPCRYNGKCSPCPEVMQLVNEGRALPLCPECLGGLSVPRFPCENVKGKILNTQGEDCTDAYSLGAQKALQLTLEYGATAAIVKSRSPSCGFTYIYDGTFSKKLIAGDGVWAGALRQAGIALYSEECLPPSSTLQCALQCAAPKA